MISPRATIVTALWAAAAVGFAATARAVPVVPDGPVDKQISFNLGGGGGGQLLFDRDVGALGVLVPVFGSDGTGVIEGQNYPGPYTFDFDIDAPLVADNSVGGQAIGEFGPAAFSLTDRDAGGVALLAGQIEQNFILKEFFSFSQTLFGTQIPFTVTGGLLAPLFAPTGTLVFNLPTACPTRCRTSAPISTAAARSP